MGGLDFSGILLEISTWAIPLIVAITFHEAAHGYVAWHLGDDTAHRMGRVTFNPLAHIDRFGTIILPGLLLLLSSPFLFGYAKPVPVRPNQFRNPRRDMMWVALAGPGTNLILAFLSALLLMGFLIYALPSTPDFAADWIKFNLRNSMLINVVLAVFNMLPLPPLDGGRVAVGLLPVALAAPLARLERHGMLILIGLLFLLPMVGRLVGADLNLFQWVIWPPVKFLYNGIAESVGLW